MKKRDFKRFEKEALVIAKHLDGQRPRFIVKDLKFDPYFVNVAVSTYKKKLQQFRSYLEGSIIQRTTHSTKKVTDNPRVIDRVRLAIEAIGFHNISALSIERNFRSNLLPGIIVPSLSSIKAILKKHFHLRFKAAKPAMVKYIDPTYNERRLWVSRILA